MKYRLLTLDELKKLEPEFVQFLSSNQITADDWISIKANNPGKVERLIEIFSDIVLEKVLGKVHYAEQRNPDSLLLFYFAAENTELIGLNARHAPGVDFTSAACIEQLANNPSEYSGIIEVFRTTRKYSRTRNEEIFTVLSSGGLITDEKLFRALSSL